MDELIELLADLVVEEINHADDYITPNTSRCWAYL